MRLSGIQIKAPGSSGPKSVKLLVNPDSYCPSTQLHAHALHAHALHGHAHAHVCMRYQVNVPSLDFDSAKSTKVGSSSGSSIYQIPSTEHMAYRLVRS